MDQQRDKHWAIAYTMLASHHVVKLSVISVRTNNNVYH